MGEKETIDKSEVYALVDGLRKDFCNSLECMANDINTAFEKMGKTLETRGKYIARRFDDVDMRLSALEESLSGVKTELSTVANWTKTTDKMYDITRTHAHEIPRIEVRLGKLEEKQNDDAENDN